MAVEILCPVNRERTIAPYVHLSFVFYVGDVVASTVLTVGRHVLPSWLDRADIVLTRQILVHVVWVSHDTPMFFFLRGLFEFGRHVFLRQTLAFFVTLYRFLPSS